MKLHQPLPHCGETAWGVSTFLYRQPALQGAKVLRRRQMPAAPRPNPTYPAWPSNQKLSRDNINTPAAVLMGIDQVPLLDTLCKQVRDEAQAQSQSLTSSSAVAVSMDHGRGGLPPWRSSLVLLGIRRSWSDAYKLLHPWASLTLFKYVSFSWHL